MSTNCLVTKLKAVVNNDSLPRLNEIVVKVASGSFQICNSTKETVIRSNKNSLSLTSGGTGSSSVTVPKANNTTTMTTVYVNQECTIYVPKYYLVRFYFTPIEDVDIKNVGLNSDLGCYISIMSSSSQVSLGSLPRNIRSISPSMCSFVFDEDEYPNLITINGNPSNRIWVVNAAEMAQKLPAIRQYNLWSTATNSTGSFDDFGLCKGLTETNGELKSYHGSGTIEGFVANQRGTTGGRPAKTTGTVKLQYLGAITFNGNVVNTDTEKTLSWTADTITFDGTTISA